jgi:hypothetical protein
MNRDLMRSLTQFLALLLPGLLVVALLGTAALALTKQEKMETCKFGAADQKLTGAKQKAFIAKCMANEPAPAKGKKKKEEKKKEEKKK